MKAAGLGIRCNRDVTAGMATGMEFTILFCRWAAQMGERLTAEAIQKRWGCSRPTAYRWRRAYLDAASREAA